MSPIQLMTLDPGHFHAALVQKEMYPGIARRVTVFAPLGTDLVDHLGRVARFNERTDNPTAWEVDVHAAPDFLERFLADPPGNVVVLAGRNRGKIAYIRSSVQAGLHVLADKPWIINSADFGKLEASLDAADKAGLHAYDIMTERYEVTSMLQRELVNDPDIFGEIVPGSVDAPGVFMRSVHHIMKLVAGLPLKRPAWFFDTGEEGEGLTDVGVHLVDLAFWALFPNQAIDYRTEIQLHGGRCWPTVLTSEEFRQVTGESRYPEAILDRVVGGRLEYFCNNKVSYSVRGVHIKLDARWDYEAPAGSGDNHLAVYRGSNACVEVRQGEAESYRPELYVLPNRAGRLRETSLAVRERIAAIQEHYPGTGVEERGEKILVTIPEELRISHEAHFAQVARQFFAYLRGEETIPVWEKPNMLAKYYVTTKALERSSD